MEPISTFLPACRQLSAGEFCRRHPHPFVVCSTLGAGAAQTPRVDTGVMTIDRLVLDGNSQVGEDGAAALKDTYRVGVLAPREPGSSVVTLGCSSRVDVRIDDGSLSKRHAVVIKADAGYRLRDNDSSAGTQLNGELLSQGDWKELSTGDRITMGMVDLIFLMPEDFQQFVLRLF